MAYLGRQPNTGVRSRYIFTATASQTTFSGSDDDGKTLKYEDAAYLDVFLNGVLLKPVTDYTATTKTSVVLTSAAAASDIVEIVAYDIANIADTVSKANGGTFEADVTVQGTVTADGLTVDTDTLYVDAANNRVGIGTAAPDDDLHIKAATPAIKLEDTDGSYGFISANADNLILGADEGNVGASSLISFKVDGTEAARIDENGTFCIGKTSTTFSDSGINIFGYGSAAGQERINITRSEGTPLNLNRKSSDGTIIALYKDGTEFGAIGSVSGSGLYIQSQQNTTSGPLIQIRDSDSHNVLTLGVTGGAYGYIGDTSGSQVGVGFVSSYLRPVTSSDGNSADNTYDIGNGSNRWDDVYATNGTINTSDANEKQHIAPLTDAEITAAKAISKLFKTFKWNDKVESKGDAARTHTGVIAQDVEQAMTDAGLDAGNYAFFISTTWYEDADGNEVEADTEGATERNRKGIRYPELLSFIGAATEQRLASIESRLDALENA